MKEPKIIVCVKQVPDPEGPASAFEVDSEGKKVIPVGIPPVISPFDENALEAALQVKESCGGIIIALSLVEKAATPVLRKAVAVGADELVLLEDEHFRDLDSYSTAYVLSAAIKKIGGYSLILMGRQAADWDAGQVGSGIAEMLGLPGVILAQKIEVIDGKVRVERVTAEGYEVVEVSLPALITVSNELGEPRYPTIRGIMAARNKEPVIWKPTDIGGESSQFGAAGRRSKLLKLFQPVHEGKCEIIAGESPEETGLNLATKLREAKIL